MAENTNQTTVIGVDTHIKGEMSFDNNARILGSFEGQINAKGELQVAEGAKCKATVEADAVLVDGVVEGDVTARDRVQLNPKARVSGDLVATKLVVADGAAFTGHCRVGPDATKNVGQKAPVAEAKPQNSQQANKQPEPARR